MQYLITNYGEESINTLLIEDYNYSFRENFEKKFNEKYDVVEKKIVEYLRKY